MGDWIAGSGPVVMWATLVVFNGAVIKLLQVVLGKVDLQQALREKAPVAGDAGQGETSYSRVAGMIGAVVLGCFFWALSNVVVFKAFGAASEIKTVLDGVGSFVLTGAAMFAPYAFNQLGRAFKPGG